MGINKPIRWDEELKTRLEWLTPEEKDRLFEILKQDKEKNEEEQEKSQPNTELFWNKEAVLEDLKENHVKIEENAEMMWYKWKKVHIDLPAVWDFEWFKFDYFVSEDTVDESDFKNGPINESYSRKEILDVLKNIWKYLNLYGIETKEREVSVGSGSYILEGHHRYLKDFLWLTKWYWLNEQFEWSLSDNHYMWFVNKDTGVSSIQGWISRWCLLLKGG